MPYLIQNSGASTARMYVHMWPLCGQLKVILAIFIDLSAPFQPRGMDTSVDAHDTGAIPHAVIAVRGRSAPANRMPFSRINGAREHGRHGARSISANSRQAAADAMSGRKSGRNKGGSRNDRH